jgi:hypothetical protein
MNKKRWFVFLGALAIFIILGGGLLIMHTNGSHQRGFQSNSDAIVKTQVKNFVESFGKSLQHISPSDSTSTMKAYQGYVSEVLMKEWQQNPKKIPATLLLAEKNTSFQIKVDSIIQKDAHTYEVKAHVASDSQNTTNAQPIELTVAEDTDISVSSSSPQSMWVITNYRDQGYGEEGTTSSSSSSSVVSPTGASPSNTGSTNNTKIITRKANGFTATAKYAGNDTWSYAVTGYLQTPCYTPKADVTVAESFPEQVALTLSILPPEKGMMCPQIIQPIHLSGSYQASTGASFSFNVNDSRNSPDNPPTSGNDLGVTSMSPKAGSIGTQVTLMGSGFETMKWVYFGNGVINPDDVQVVSDSEITFDVPSGSSYPCRFSHPACMIATPRISAGNYIVTVAGSDGKKVASHQVFTVTGGVSSGVH